MIALLLSAIAPVTGALVSQAMATETPRARKLRLKRESMRRLRNARKLAAKMEFALAGAN